MLSQPLGNSPRKQGRQGGTRPHSCTRTAPWQQLPKAGGNVTAADLMDGQRMQGPPVALQIPRQIAEALGAQLPPLDLEVVLRDRAQGDPGLCAGGLPFTLRVLPKPRLGQILAGDLARLLWAEQLDTADCHPPLLVAAKLILGYPCSLATSADAETETTQLLVEEDCILLASR
jgi:hypothetical protein